MDVEEPKYVFIVLDVDNESLQPDLLR